MVDLHDIERHLRVAITFIVFDAPVAVGIPELLAREQRGIRRWFAQVVAHIDVADERGRIGKHFATRSMVVVRMAIDHVLDGQTEALVELIL